MGEAQEAGTLTPTSFSGQKKKDWKPWQLSPFFLIPLIVIALALAIGLEVAAKKWKPAFQ